MTDSRHGDGDAMPPVPVVVLISADWAGPSRPAPTVLRELAARWKGAVETLLIEDPDDEVLDLFAVDFLPTWLRCTRVPTGEVAKGRGERTISAPHTAGTGATSVNGLDVERPLRVPELAGRDPRAGEVVLPGPWVVQHRRSGALPKHVVEAEFGPSAAMPGRAALR